jgi:hypothetical protein
MRKAIAGAITLTTLTVAIQSSAQTPPPAPIMPPSLPAAHVVNLMTNEGSGAFGVQWRVADVRIVEVPGPLTRIVTRPPIRSSPEPCRPILMIPNGSGSRART